MSLLSKKTKKSTEEIVRGENDLKNAVNLFFGGSGGRKSVRGAGMGREKRLSTTKTWTAP